MVLGIIFTCLAIAALVGIVITIVRAYGEDDPEYLITAFVLGMFMIVVSAAAATSFSDAKNNGPITCPYCDVKLMGHKFDEVVTPRSLEEQCWIEVMCPECGTNFKAEATRTYTLSGKLVETDKQVLDFFTAE